MKTIKIALPLFVLAACAYSLKAQQTFGRKPADSLSDNPLDKYFKNKQNNDRHPLEPKFNLNEELSAINDKKFNVNAEPFYSTMPVAALRGYSKMPVVKPQGYHTMPVKRIKLANPRNEVLKTDTGMPVINNSPALTAPVQRY